MFYIGLTKKLSEKLNVDMNVIPDVKPMDIYCWHANLFIWNRRNCALVMNDRTRYCVMLYGLKKSDMRDFYSIFSSQLRTNLINDGVSQEIIKCYLSHVKELYFTKTSSRSMIGSINDIIYGITYHIDKYYGDGKFYQDEINSAVNNQVIMPLDKIGLPPFPKKAMKVELERLFNND